jgi:hypothetical protein
MGPIVTAGRQAEVAPRRTPKASRKCLILFCFPCCFSFCSLLRDFVKNLCSPRGVSIFDGSLIISPEFSTNKKTKTVFVRSEIDG